LPAASAHTKLWIDPDKLLQALQIILDNAIRYSGKQKIVNVNIQIEDQCRIWVRDYGFGIASDDLPNVFKRYFRAENARDLRPDGLGIGLSLCETLVNSQHGTIELLSEQDQGTTVAVNLPLIEEDN
jgi:signal transduction histidine kinase